MDKKKRLLIFMKEEDLKPTGGPAGYNYNLKQELDKLNIDGVDFIKGEASVDFSNTFTSNIVLKKIRRFVGIFRRTIYYSKLLLKSEYSEIIEKNEYDMIHFHFTEDIFRYRKSLEKYNGKIILTSHSPTLASLQIYDTLTGFEKVVLKPLYSKLKKMDYYAFEKTNYIIFPCPEAEEPYYNNWPGYKDFKEANKDKYLYLVTGINQCFAKIDRDNIRKKYEIPNDAFLISYVGRHNKIKGYDLLKDICEKVIDDNTYVIVAGKEEPIKRLKNDNWIEVGWTNDPHSLINASDIFVLPNRETYFDLVMLEVLSLGVPVIASNTGGNKYFKNKEGIFIYDTIDEAADIINKLKAEDRSKVKELGLINKQLFEEEFSCEVFAKNYIKTIEEIEAK